MNYVNIDLDNGLSPEQRQASIQSCGKCGILQIAISEIFWIAFYRV